jgi:hypothetical protein
MPISISEQAGLLDSVDITYTAGSTSEGDVWVSRTRKIPPSFLYLVKRWLEEKSLSQSHN